MITIIFSAFRESSPEHAAQLRPRPTLRRLHRRPGGKTGRYNNASEVVREALRLLEDRERLREIRLVELRRLAEEGRRSGLADENGEAALSSLGAEYRSMRGQRPG